MYLDEAFAFGGGHAGPICRACKQPILDGERSTRVSFRTDPDGAEGLTGEYHIPCSKPFASLAHVLNLNPWGGR
jgi:hypothetical protein